MKYFSYPIKETNLRIGLRGMLFEEIGMDRYSENVLQEVIASGNMEEVTAALNEIMKQKEKEKLVIEKYGEAKKYFKKKNGKTIEYWRIGTTYAKEKKDLYDKMFALMGIEEKSPETVRELYKIAIERKRKNGIVEYTLDHYASTWNRFIENSKLADMPVGQVKTSTLVRFFEDIGNENISKKQFDDIKTVTNMIFDEAEHLDLITFNPSRECRKIGLKFKTGKVRNDGVYTHEERKKLLAYLATLPTTRYTLAVEFMFCFYMRIGEGRALRWEDYDEEIGMLHIWREIVKRPRDGKKRCDTEVPHTKSGLVDGERWVQVPRRAKRVLKKLREINGDKTYILNGDRDAAYSIPENKFNEHLRAYCEAAGIRYFPSHNFRFYGISGLFEKGANRNGIQRGAGHANGGMTDVYNRSSSVVIFPEEMVEDIWD